MLFYVLIINWVFYEFDEDRRPTNGFFTFYIKFNVFKFELIEFLKLENSLLEVLLSFVYLFVDEFPLT